LKRSLKKLVEELRGPLATTYQLTRCDRDLMLVKSESSDTQEQLRIGFDRNDSLISAEDQFGGFCTDEQADTLPNP